MASWGSASLAAAGEQVGQRGATALQRHRGRRARSGRHGACSSTAAARALQTTPCHPPSPPPAFKCQVKPCQARHDHCFKTPLFLFYDPDIISVEYKISIMVTRGLSPGVVGTRLRGRVPGALVGGANAEHTTRSAAPGRRPTLILRGRGTWFQQWDKTVVSLSVRCRSCLTAWRRL